MRTSRVAIVAAGAIALAACSSGSARVAPRATPSTPAHGSTSSTSTVAGGTTPPSTTPAVSAPQQRTEPSLPVAIQEAGAATVGNQLYVIGGYDTARNSTSGVYVFDGSSWRRGPALPIAVNHPGVAAIGTNVYVVGGFTPNGATNRAFVLAAGAPAWRELAPLHRARGALTLLAEQGHLYAIGGRDRSAQLAVPEVFAPAAGTWSDGPSMPGPRNHLAGYLDGSLLCVAGGRTPDTSGAIDCLDPATSTWQSHGTLPTPTSGAAAAVIDGVSIVAGGEPATETHLVDVVQMLRAGAWTSMPMLVPRHGAANAVYRGRLWACGGATAPGFHAVATCTSIAG